MNLYELLYENYHKIKNQQPIILNLTNSVTQDFMANALLAIGASPIMSDDFDELDELMLLASGVNLNIGTYNVAFREKAKKVSQLANQLNKPVILDPVGAAATHKRLALALELANFANIICGNSSEIMAISYNNILNVGIDSISYVENLMSDVKDISNKLNAIIIVTGKTDLIVFNDKQYINHFGQELMKYITGMGCILNAIILAFATVCNDYLLASILGISLYTLSADKVYMNINTPAKFKNEFIDNLYMPDWDFIKLNLKGKQFNYD